MMTNADDIARQRSVHARWLAVLLALVTAALFSRSLPYAFVAYDDDTFVYENPVVKQGLTREGVEYAFAIHGPSQYHPIAYLSHMVDVSLFGLKPAGHRAHSILAHAASAALLLLLLHRLTGSVWRSALVAAVFALHPLRVESVVWIAERKDVTCMLLMLLTLHAYVSYARAPSEGRPSAPLPGTLPGASGPSPRVTWYIAVVALFAMSLLSKPMAVTLPGVMWLLDYWPLGRIAKPQACAGGGATPATPAPVALVVIEKFPLLALGGASMWLTVLCQRDAGTVMSLDSLPMGLRVVNALASLAAYTGKLFWPTDLAVLYPLRAGPNWPMASIGAATLVVVTTIALAQRRTRPAILVGWLWYLGTLLPVIGLVQVGVQSMADRYTYLPLIGPTIALVWLAGEAVAPLRATRALGAAMGALAISAMCLVTWRQLPHWRDSESLFRQAIAATGDNAVMEFNLGNVLTAQQRYDEAVTHLRRAAEIDPRQARYPNNLGIALIRSSRASDAVAAFRRAIELDPNHPSARSNLGAALMETDDLAGAIHAFHGAIEHRPNSVEARRGLSITHNTLGTRLAREGKMREAVAEFETAMRVDPDNAAASVNYERARRAAATQPAPR